MLEKKENLKRYRLTSLMLSALVLSVIGFIALAGKTNKVEAQVGGPFLYDNGGLATGAVSNSGVSAPTGTQWSEAQNETGNTTFSNSTAGASCSLTTTLFRCADNFTVPTGRTWTINQVVTYAYQTGSTGTTSPITGATLQIWSGRPGDAGSTVIFGNTTTNRLATSVDTSLFRIFNSAVPSPGTATGTTRRIWQNNISVSPAQVLTAGTYWIDFQTQVSANAAHFAPAVTIPGIRTQASWNARQFNGTAWVDFLDVGNPDASAPDVAQDFPFKLVGTSSSPVVTQDPNVDFDGDGVTDYSVARDTTAAFIGQNQFFRSESIREKMRFQSENPQPEADAVPGSGIAFFVHNSQNGSDRVSLLGQPSTDFFVPSDYDGDNRADIAVWRPGAPNVAAFYILQSSNSTVRTELFGQTGDDPAITGDYDGDGRSDVATYRCPALGSGNGQCFFYYRGSQNNPNGTITYVPWGFGETFDFFVNPGDFDGDGRFDFCIQRTNPAAAGSGQFVLLGSFNGGVEFITWGRDSDVIVPGDYDGDGRSDFMVSRTENGGRSYYLLERDGGGTGSSPIRWGLAADVRTPGDYDGDGRTDVAIWRPSTDPNANFFYVLRSSNGALQAFEYGSGNDVPLAGWNVH